MRQRRDLIMSVFKDYEVVTLSAYAGYAPWRASLSYELLSMGRSFGQDSVLELYFNASTLTVF